MAEGVDYAFPPKPRPAVLAQQGKTFVCRYGGKGTTDKMLTASELAGLRANGVDVVANVEGSAGGFSGYAAGRDWALAGLSWFGDLGMPADRPLYFSADWDVQPSDWGNLASALQGAASVIGQSRVGLYGGRYAILRSQETGLARWYWQTFAWSTVNGKVVWVPDTHIQQYRNGVTIDGADCDLDRSMQADYGQWGYQEVPDVELTDKYGDRAWTGRTVADRMKDDASMRDWLYGDGPGTQAGPGFSAGAPLPTMLAAARLVPSIATALTALAAKVDADVSDLETAIGQVDDQVLAGLTAAGRAPADVAAALVAALGQEGAAAVAHAVLGS